MKTLEQRYHEAIKRIGGAVGLLALPRSVQEILKACNDLESKVKMFELIADELHR